MATANGAVMPLVAPQKVGPHKSYVLARSRLASALLAWADKSGAGYVRTQSEFRVTPSGEITRPLTPDIAFISYPRLPHGDNGTGTLYMSPDVAFEILTSSHRPREMDERTRTYLASGTQLVVIVDPERRTFTTRDGGAVKVFGADATFKHPALPDFAVRVGAVLEKPTAAI